MNEPSPESIFADFLAATERGEVVDLESRYKGDPRLAEVLRLHAQWLVMKDVLDEGPLGSVDVQSASGDERAWERFLDQLRSRGQSYTRYSLRGEIAKGGQGVIHRVWDEDARRPLAMKVILGQAESAPSGDTQKVDERTLGRFLEEAQVTSQLDHPGIVPVHEIGVDAQGRVYFTMKLVKGTDLRSVIDRLHDPQDAEWSLPRLIGVLHRVCEAMSYAHAKGVVHRDLKPGNVMVGRFGEVFVMDWGLARVLGARDFRDVRIRPAATVSESVLRSDRRSSGSDTPEDALLTMDGDVVGTPAYMPPEQAAGRLQDIGPPSDVYAVGAILYHVLCGHMPYVPTGDRVSNRMVLAMVGHGPPRPIASEARKAPPELIAICDKAMAWEITDRYPDMTTLATDLRAYLENRVVRAYRTGPAAELGMWVRRNRLAAVLAVAGVLSVASIGGALVRAEVAGSRREAVLKVAEEQALVQAANRARALGSARLQQAANLLDEGRNAAAVLVLDKVEPTQRGFVWQHLKLRSDLSIDKVAGDSEHIQEAAFSADGRFIIMTSSRAAARIVDTTTGRQDLLAAQGLEFVRSVAISGDGVRIALGDASGRVQVRERETDALIDAFQIESPMPPSEANGVVLDQAGETIAARSYVGPLVVRSLATGVQRQHPSQATERSERSGGLPLAITPDGVRVAFVAHDGRVWMWRWRDEDPKPIVLPVNARADCLAFTNTGLSLGVGGSGQGLVWGVEEERLMQVHAIPAVGMAWHLAFEPDRRRTLIATHSVVAGLVSSTIVVQSGEGNARLRGSGVSPVAVYGDGARIWSVDSTGAVFTFEGHAQDGYSRLLPGVTNVVAGAFAGAGDRLAVATNAGRSMGGGDFRTLILDGQNGRPRHAIDGDEFAFCPDGKRLVIAGSVHAWALDKGSGPAMSSREIAVWDLDGDPRKTVVGPAKWGVNDLAWSPDGTRIAAAMGSVLTDDGVETIGANSASSPGHRHRDGYVVHDALVRVFDAETLGLVAEHAVHSEPVSAVVFDGTGDVLYSGGVDGAIHAYDAESGRRERPVFQDPDDSIRALAVDPHSGHLLVAQESGVARLLDPATGAVSLVLPHSDAVVAVAFSPDGSLMATVSGYRLFLWNRSGDLLMDADGHDWVAFSADGSRLATGDRIYESDTQSATQMWREARSIEAMLRRLDAEFGSNATRDEVVAKLSQDPTLTPADLDLVIPLAWIPREVNVEAILSEELVASLFDRDAAAETHAAAVRGVRYLAAEYPSVVDGMVAALAEIRAGKLAEARVALAPVVAAFVEDTAPVNLPERRREERRFMAALVDVLAALVEAHDGRCAAARETAERAKRVFAGRLDEMGMTNTFGRLLQEIDELCEGR